MADMNEVLGDVFGTKTASAQVSAPTSEDLEKQAQLGFFQELCQTRGIDLSRLEDAQVENLFKTAMELKAASEESPEEKAKKEKAEKMKSKEASVRAEAEREYTEKRAAAAKIAEADLMGRIMARSYVDELQKIAGEMPPAFAAHAAGKEGEGKEKKEGKEKDEKEEADKKKEASDRAAALIAEVAANKTASANTASDTPTLDQLAGQHAFELCKQAGLDTDVAYARLNAVLVLGMPESTKVASAVGTDAAIHLRALEIAEAAGYPVDWTSVK